MLRGAVIGFGRMGLTHFSILNNHPEVQFVAVCDSSSFMLKNIGKYIGIETFKDYRKMIDRSGLDFVIVATPTGMHAEIVKYAIQNNLHIFVEKPFTLSVRQGKEVLYALAGKNLVNQVGYVYRFNDVYVQLKDIIQSGMLGNLLSFKAEFYSQAILKNVKSGWRSKATAGGGCLRDFASHLIDLLNYSIGRPPERVTGSVLKRIYSLDLEDAVYSTFLYPDNLSGQLMVNWSDPSYRKPEFHIEFFGDNGRIIADLLGFKLFLKEEIEGTEFTKGWNLRYLPELATPIRFYVRGYEYTRQLDYFIDSIIGKVPCTMCTFENGLLADSVTELIIRDFAERN